MPDTNSTLLRPLDVRRSVRKNVIEVFGRLSPGHRVFDIGCGTKPFSADLTKIGCICIGVDIDDGFYDQGFIDLVGSAYRVPAADGEADAVMLIQVIEHLDKPQEAFAEAHRLLKPGGIAIVTSPFLYPIHAAPHDYLRYTRFFIEGLAEKTGFEVVERREIAGYWFSAGVNCALYMQSFNRGLLARFRVIDVAIALAQWMFRGLHALESALLNLARVDSKNVRSLWPVNYVFVLAKTS